MAGILVDLGYQSVLSQSRGFCGILFFLFEVSRA